MRRCIGIVPGCARGDSSLRSKWAELLFADPIANIAVLGVPDGQVVSEQADDYEALVASAHPLAIAAQREECKARVLSLGGCWREGRVEHRNGRLRFCPEEFIEPGMSGSPIINMSGKAIGVISVSFRFPALVHSLSTAVLRSIRGARWLPHAGART